MFLQPGMATVTSWRGKSEVVTARRTEPHDVPAIVALFSPETEDLFGRTDVTYLLELSNLALTLCNEKNEVLAHAAFLDYPNWNITDQAEWEPFLHKNYTNNKCTPLNTLFVHLFVAKEEYGAGCSQEIVRRAFILLPELQFILLFVPPEERLELAMGNVFERMLPVAGSPMERGFTLLACPRQRCHPRLYVRQARMEDYDDLMLIWTPQSETLKETYGEHVLVDLLERKGEENQAAVCEVEPRQVCLCDVAFVFQVDGTAVGFMSLCSHVNISLFQECFDLGPFHGLCKPHPEDILKVPRKPSVQGDEDESNQTSDKPEPVSSQNLEHVPGADAAVQADEALAVPQAEVPAGDESSAGSPGSAAPLLDTDGDFHPIYRGAPNVFCIRLLCIDEKYESRSLDFLQYAFSVFPALATRGTDLALRTSTLRNTAYHQRKFLETAGPGSISNLVFELKCHDGIARCSKEGSPHSLLKVKPFLSAAQTEPCLEVCSVSPVFRADRDLCVMLVPHHVPERALLRSFVRAVPCCTSRLGRELYVFHRAGLLTSFNVRKAATSDLEGIKMLVETLSLNERIWNDSKIFTEARREPDGMPVQAFVAEVSDQIVGVGITRDEMDIEYIRSHYNIEDFIHFNHHQQEEHGHLCHFVLNPVFRHYTKYFLKEILRLGHKTSLYYPIYPEYVEGKRPCAHSLTSALHYMAPVRPRRQIVYPVRELGASAPPERVSEDQPKYSLNHTNRKLVLESKVCINTRIVVVGASDVGISFLETLIFWPRLKFNNLTLISIHGLPGKDPQSSKYRRFLINRFDFTSKHFHSSCRKHNTFHCFNDEDYAQMSLCSWVNVVVGKVTAINRRAKHVVVSKEKPVPYDYLVLCTGQSYQSFLQALAPAGADVSEVTGQWPQRYTGRVPPNHFTLNDSQDCLEAARWLEENLDSSEGNIIVYGNTIDIYTTVEALLSLGIDGSRIHLVQAPPASASPCLGDSAVQRRVQEALAEAGVAVHPEHVLARWGRDEHGHITWAAFS
ncbi:hypothetical protein IHE44_0008726, partial [Lamprotornis superbus]